MKKIKIYQIKTFIVKKISGKPLPNSSNYSRNQSPYNSNYRGRSPDQRNSRNFSQNIYSQSSSRNTQYRINYSRSNSNRPEYLFDTSSTHALGLDTIQMIDQETHRTTDIEIIPTIGIEASQIIETNDIKLIDHEIIQTADHITKDLTTTTIKIDYEITHKKRTQIITIDKETTLNHLIEIIHVIPIPETNIEAIHQKIEDKQIKRTNK